MNFRSICIWGCFAAFCLWPIWIAADSSLLQYRQWVYICAGFAGIIGFVLLFLQPLLIAQFLPHVSGSRTRRWHRLVGIFTTLAVVLHVAGLWVTSPPDVVDALLLRSATPFSIYGVLAMWAVFATAAVAVLRKRLRVSPRLWRLFHGLSAAVMISATVVHVWLIDGTMGAASKMVFACLVVAAAIYALLINKRTRLFR